MRGVYQQSSYYCVSCLRARLSALTHPWQAHRYASTPASPPSRDGEASDEPGQEEEQGALSRRLAQLSEENIEAGGKSALRAVEEAGFSDVLKSQLEEKIASASFRSENASALAEANMPSSAGRGTRYIGSTRPWNGTESAEDASLRMLTDVYKPMKAPSRVPGVRGPPTKVDTGRPAKGGTGTRLANARDKTSVYSYIKDPTLSEQEREKFRKELKQRFEPSARAVPATIQGLASLANERIEDAIARGQFKNLPRGKKIERDHNASNPFLDTT